MDEFRPLSHENAGNEEQYQSPVPGNFKNDLPRADLKTPTMALCSLLGILTFRFFTLYCLFRDTMQIFALSLLLSTFSLQVRRNSVFGGA
jgi:hypothetical protein